MPVTINGTTGITTPNLINGSSLNFRNKIINGNFDIWQRGTSHSNDGFGSVDRWSNSRIGTANTVSRQSFTLGQTNVPNEPTYFCRNVVTSVAGSGNYVFLRQSVEDVRSCSGKTVTLSFYAKADSSKNIAVEFSQDFGTGGTPSTEVTAIGVTTCSLTTSWNKFTVTATIPSLAGKTLGTDNNHFLRIGFWLNAGSNFNSRTNSLGQQSGTFDIAQVQLEEGSVATPFELRPIGTELALCQRYYHELELEASGFGGPGMFNTAFPFLVQVAKPPTVTTILAGTSVGLSNLVSLGGVVTKCDYEATTPINGYWDYKNWRCSVDAEF